MSELVHKCPECGKPSTPQYRPFCSKRCANIDLGRWLTGGYVIAGGDSDADEDGDVTDAGPVRSDVTGACED